MMDLENLTAVLAEVEDVKNIFKANNYKITAVENWLYVNEAKLVVEMTNLHRDFKRKNISFQEYFKLIDASDNKHETLKVVFRAYKEYFNVNVFFDDFFDSQMNPDYAKATKEIYGE